MSGKVPTNYRQMKNRCPRCRHRLAMRQATGNRCTVRTAVYDQHHKIVLGEETICPCGKHRRP